MATAMTFTSLLAQLRAYLERGNVADEAVYEQLPNLVNNGERRIATELKIEGFLVFLSGTMTAGTSVYPKPVGWKRTTSWRIGTGATLSSTKYIYTRVYEFLRFYWPDSSLTAEPEFYSDYNFEHWLVAPTPDLAYPYEVSCYVQHTLLSEENQTNWLTENVPQLVLYAALLEATPFLKDDARIPIWKEFYDRTASTLNGEDMSRIFDRAAVRKEA